MATAKRILFVCLGNICRSPAAEGVMKSLLAERGLEEIVDVDSAGTGSWHAGEPADDRMRAAAESRGFLLESLARQVRAQELSTYDLVIAMDLSNRDDLEALLDGAPENLRLLSEFLPPGAPPDVPDPYFGGPGGFDLVLDMLEEACPRILDELLG